MGGGSELAGAQPAAKCSTTLLYFGHSLVNAAFTADTVFTALLVRHGWQSGSPRAL